MSDLRNVENPEARRRQLAALLQARAAAPVDRPLSPGQERLWRLARLAPDAPLYNVAVAYRIEGPLDIAALEGAARRIADRHDVLRTTFALVDGAPVQRVSPRGTAIPVITRGDLAGNDEAAGLAAFIAAQASRRYDLAAGPCWHMAVARLGPACHVLVLTMHHIVTDGWSFELFLGELSALYRPSGQEPGEEPPPPPAQYADIAERQRRETDSDALDGQRAYWRRAFETSPPALRLPADRTGTAADREAASVAFALDADATAALVTLGQDEAASTFIITLSAFAAVLGRSTGQEDILVCTPVAGRHRARTREVIGYFNNILPMRVDLSGSPNLIEVLRRTRTMALAAFQNQDVPFQWIAELAGLRQLPLSRLLFSLDMPWPPVLALPGLACSSLPVETGTADFDLSVSLWIEADGLRGTLRYKSALFDGSTIKAVAQAYADALRALATTPDAPLSTIAGVARTGDIAAARPASTETVLPRTPIELRLAQEWEAVFERQPVGVTDDLEALGASSLMVATLAERIEAAFRTPVPVTSLFSAGTIERMAALLQGADASLGRSPLAPIRSTGHRPPLFLCEGVGIYYPLVRRLDPGQPVWGLVTELVGDYPDVETLAGHYVEAIRSIRPHGPYLLGGISFGGLVAFEMAQQLVAAGERVALLALFDTPGPGAYRRKGLLGRLIGHARNVLRYGTPYVAAKLGRRRGPAAGSVSEPEGEVRRLVPDQSRVRAVFERAADRYVVRPYPGQITLFSLAHRDGMSDALFDPALGHIDPQLGWGRIAQDGVVQHSFGGDHISMLREPHVAELAAVLERRLAAVTGETPSV